MPLRWPRIALLAFAMTSAIAVIGAYPLTKHKWAGYEAQKFRTRATTGLTPCDASEKAMIDEIDSRLGQDTTLTPDVSITAFRSFSEPVGVRVSGTTAVYFRLLPPRVRSGPSETDPHGWIRIDTPHKTRLSSRLTRSIRDTLASDIAHAQAKVTPVIDGTTYYFRTADGSCGMTSSPEARTRAAKWVALFRALLERSQPNATTDDEAKIRQTIEALRAD